MPDYTFNVFRMLDIGGTDGLELAGAITMRDDDGNRDSFFDDIESAGTGETNGDQEILTSSVAELDAADTIRTRGIYQFTNNATGETYEVTEIFSQTAGHAVETLFIFTSTAPAWIFDGTSRSFALTNANGTLPYSSIVCFGAGTLITLQDGRDVPVEDLAVGDHVLTLGGSAQAVRWIGSRGITPFGLIANPKLRPIRIKAGALGSDLPTQDLVVSPQHRVLIRSKIATRIFSTDEVLVPAHKLVELDGIEVADDMAEVTYFHILLEDHQIIYSNGAPTESLLTEAEAMKAITPKGQAELKTLFPEIFAPGFSPKPASFIPEKGKEIKDLVARHQKNQKPLLASL